MADKETKMEIKVDLKCSCCYKKIKKLICKFPEIREYAFDEQKNLVKITVASSDPDGFRQKLCCKGRKIIISITIVKPAPPPPPTQKDGSKKEPEPKQPPPQPPPPPPAPAPTVSIEFESTNVFPFGLCCPQCVYTCGGGPCKHGCGRSAPPPPPPLPPPPLPTCFDWCICGRGCPPNPPWGGGGSGCQPKPCGGGGRGCSSRPCFGCGSCSNMAGCPQQPLLFGGCNCGNMGCRRCCDLFMKDTGAYGCSVM